MAKCLSSICAVNLAARGDFLQDILAVSARRALEKEKIDSLEKLSGYSEDEIMQLNGFGSSTMNKLKNHMKEHNISFKECK